MHPQWPEVWRHRSQSVHERETGGKTAAGTVVPTTLTVPTGIGSTTLEQL